MDCGPRAPGRFRADRAAARLEGVASLVGTGDRRGRDRGGPAPQPAARHARRAVGRPLARADSRGRSAGRADLHAARRHRALRVARARHAARRPSADGVPAVDDVARHRRHPTLHALRLPARGRTIVGAAPPPLSRVGRLDAGRHRHRRRDAVRLLHLVHRRFRGDDPGARRPPAARARRQRLSRAVFDRPADGLRVARPALPALAALDALWHRVAESVHRGSVHRRTGAGDPDARAPRGARCPRGSGHEGAARAVSRR